ncbi:MAG TPA: murein biosynthesis integral membrane protein MurJ, partial [Myxococcaceae bacterium]|nr:murein biosynthesis integral membrane protein MurJ [Myxococcaceae bacterium]
MVAAGILASRLFGLVRERVFAHYFGSSVAAAAFKAALRIPNFLQNLFGEGVLSASFIPVYAQLLGRGDREQARRVAGAVFGLLSLATSVLVALGVWLTPAFIDAIAPGFEGEARALAIQLVRILFPMTGILVLSAWCLGVLNSHGRFFLSYAAPIIWNGAMIAAMVMFGGNAPDELAVYLAWGAVAGGVLQFLVQLPSVLSLLGGFRPSLSIAIPGVRQVMRSFGPVVAGRGVVQISAYVDTAYASLIAERALAALAYGQTLYLIPVSLFGMSVSAAELPAMARATGEGGDVSPVLRERIGKGLERIAFFVVPSAAAFLMLGDVVGAALLQTGRFTAGDARYLWYVLMGASVGLLASTQARLYASGFYARKDTRTPLLFAIVRVLLGAGLAWFAGLRLPGLLGVPAELGVVGLTAASGLAAWVEFLLLRARLRREIGGIPGNGKRLATLWGAAAAAGLLGISLKLALTHTFGASPEAVAQWGGTVLPQP